MLGEGTILAVLDLAVFILVVIWRKRCSRMLVIVPLFFFISNCLVVYAVIQFYQVQYNGTDPFSAFQPKYFALSNFFMLVGEWLFSSQYLHTSLILPKLFTDKLSLILPITYTQETENEEDEFRNSLANSNPSIVQENIITIMKRFDDGVTERKESARKINIGI